VAESDRIAGRDRRITSRGTYAIGSPRRRARQTASDPIEPGWSITSAHGPDSSARSSSRSIAASSLLTASSNIRSPAAEMTVA